MENKIGDDNYTILLLLQNHLRKMNINEFKRISLLKKLQYYDKRSSRRERLKPAWKRKIKRKSESKVVNANLPFFQYIHFLLKCQARPPVPTPDLSIPYHTYSGHDKLCELLSWTNHQPKIKHALTTALHLSVRVCVNLSENVG